MNNGSKERENTIREEFKRNLAETLSAKGQKRWALLEALASEHGFRFEDRYTYRYDKSYVMKIGRTIIYLDNITNQSYMEIRELLEKKERIKTGVSMIGTAITVGSSALGGAVLGYLLIMAGLHPLVMIPSIIVPPGVGIYEMLKQSAKESNKLAEINNCLEEHKEDIFFEDDAIRRFSRGIYKRALLGRYPE